MKFAVALLLVFGMMMLMAGRSIALSLDRLEKSEEEWRTILTLKQFEVARNKGTERAFTGVYWNHNESGVYLCVCCGTKLFSSGAKYDSGSGWPSFRVAEDGAPLVEVEDTSLGMVRTEVICGRCDAHLGHLFHDGPPPKGIRYCINSASLRFLPDTD